MTDTRSITENAQNQTLDFVRQSQEAFVEAMQVWSDSLNRLVGTAQERTGDAGDIPKPDEVMDQVFDFAQSLLTAQREFAHNVLRTTSNLWATGEQAVAHETKRTADSAKKTAAKA
jgi:hypothetical protein